MMGKPVIAGTRITVELILEKLAAGETVEALRAAGFDVAYAAESHARERRSEGYRVVAVQP